jgi:Ca2+-transporting ATPase
MGGDSAYRQAIDDVISVLATDPRSGLSAGEAQSRLERYGRNELEAEKPLPAWRRFLAQFQDVLVILLLVATAISAALWAYERDAALPYEAIAISRSCCSTHDGLRPGVAGGGGGRSPSRDVGS